MTEDKIKQILCIRQDLNMRRGKQISQGAHASMMFISRHYLDNASMYQEFMLGDVDDRWLNGIFTKIVVGVDSEEELLALYTKALADGLHSYYVEDEGLTEFKGVKTITALAIGPDYSSKIDPITKHLRLI